MDDVTIPGEPIPKTAFTRRLTLAASALTATSLFVNLLLQVASFLEKRPMEPDQRDRLDSAGLAINVLKRLPSLIKQVRLLVAQLKAV